MQALLTVHELLFPFIQLLVHSDISCSADKPQLDIWNQSRLSMKHSVSLKYENRIWAWEIKNGAVNLQELTRALSEFSHSNWLEAFLVISRWLLAALLLLWWSSRTWAGTISSMTLNPETNTRRGFTCVSMRNSIFIHLRLIQLFRWSEQHVLLHGICFKTAGLQPCQLFRLLINPIVRAGNEGFFRYAAKSSRLLKGTLTSFELTTNQIRIYDLDFFLYGAHRRLSFWNYMNELLRTEWRKNTGIEINTEYFCTCIFPECINSSRSSDWTLEVH